MEGISAGLSFLTAKDGTRFTVPKVQWMRAGYLTLFGMVVAYSAYQSVSSTSTHEVAGAVRAQASSEIEKPIARPSAVEPSLIEPFPTIAGGHCKLTIDTNGSPCAGCPAICPARELRDVIGDYFREENETADRSDDLAAHWNVPHRAQAHIRFVIATLPDPVHTRMALIFDRFIETIERAAEADHYFFFRSWMPWDISAHSESNDFTVRLAQQELQNAKESLPGLLIFRQPDPTTTSSTTLFVFVVGETPTSGLHQQQFQNALNIRYAILSGADESEDRDILRILGPSSSGSLFSLQAILNSPLPQNQFRSVVVRSGTVSSFRAVHDFCQGTSANKVDFATFQFSDKYVEYYLSVFFKEREGPHSHVAILSEDETVFGSQERSQHDTSNVAVNQPGSCGPSGPELPAPVIPYLRLYFPREIAQLRDAYQRAVKTEQAGGDTGKAHSPSGLPLSLGATGSDDDSVVPYSPLQLPLSQESILQSIVATLRRQHARVVVIRASDPLDMVFLSRYLRQNYPQARLVTISLDLLMIHDFYDPKFHGILAVAAYPLLNGAEFPKLIGTSDNQEIHRLFSDSYSAGEFNAFESLLASTAKTSGSCLPPAKYAQFGYPSFVEGRWASFWQAHLWLTTVGREGYWPVTVLDDVDPSRDQRKTIEIPRPTIPPVDAGARFAEDFSVHFSIGWTIFWSMSLGMTVFLAFLLGYPRTFTRSELLARFGGFPSAERNRLLFALSMLVLATQTLFMVPIIVWLWRFGFVWQGWQDAFAGMEVSAGAYLASVLFLGYTCRTGFTQRAVEGDRGDHERFSRLGMRVCLVAVVVFLFLIVWPWPGKLGGTLGPFVYRYMEVGSGVSPCLPLLFVLAAWIWWCWQSLTGVGSTEEKHMVLPHEVCFDKERTPDLQDPTRARLDVTTRVRLKELSSERNQLLWSFLNAAPFDKGKKIRNSALLIFGLIFLWMRPDEIAEAFETRPYRWLYWILLYSCLLLLCYLVSHIVALWFEYRNLLRVINRLPFRRGFADLKSLTWKPLWKLAGNGRQEFLQLLGNALDALRQIENEGKATPEFENAVGKAKEAEEKLSAVYESYLHTNGQGGLGENLEDLFEKLQKALASTACEALAFASRKWKTERYETPKESNGNHDTDHCAPVVPAQDAQTRAVEHFICLFYLNVILVPLRRLQTLILAMAGVFVFVLLSYSSYPFESRESFHALLISIFFAMSLVVGVVFGQMYADPLLSLITNTKPGELGLDFWIRIGSFVFIPLLSLLSVQFPEVNNFLFSWLQPALQSVK